MVHLAAGSRTVLGAQANNATEDSQERFFGSVFTA
jgi:hypothetical protein